jgi:hypothetical protein
LRTPRRSTPPPRDQGGEFRDERSPPDEHTSRAARRDLPLKKGRNELMLAVSELGGGWGFICRLADEEK